MSTDTLFYPTREVPVDWTTDLESVIPRSDRLPWLAIRWHAGIQPYGITNRWTIYTMQPRLDLVPSEILDSLEGADPREHGTWITPKVRDANNKWTLGERRWVSESFVSREQWLAYRETKCFPQLFWVIQGSHGGHKWQLSQTEVGYLKATGRETYDTPNIGALPYAPYDNRVREKIVRYDKLRRWRQRMDWEARYDRGVSEAGIIVQQERTTQEQAYAKAALTWLEDQIQDAVDDIPRRILGKLFDTLQTKENLPTPDEIAEQSRRLVTETSSYKYPE